MRMLVIDDDVWVLRLQNYLLRAHDVSTASSGSEALALLASKSFDVILCDLHMPNMNGRVFLGHLSALDATRVIFVSGGAYAPGDQAFLAERRTLMKPFTRKALMDAIDDVVELAVARARGPRSHFS